MTDIILIQVFSCWFLTGLIWLIQVLVYPNFKLVGSSEFKSFHEFHVNRITWIVAPVMGLELISGILLFANDHTAFYFWNGVSILALWGITGLINVPCHNRLKHNEEISKRHLVLSNWPRTLTWSLRSGVWLWYLHAQFAKGF